jgi:hypothetical protein
MRCEQFEQLAALAASGDLSVRDRALLNAHLAICESCRIAASEFSRLQSELAGLEEEALDPAIYAALRRAVLNRIADKPKWLLPVWLRVAVASAAVLVLVLLETWNLPRENAPINAQPATVRAAVSPVAPVIPTVRRSVTRKTQFRRRIAAEPVERQPLVVKMLTNDPNVVVIWLVDKQGD